MRKGVFVRSPSNRELHQVLRSSDAHQRPLSCLEWYLQGCHFGGVRRVEGCRGLPRVCRHSLVQALLQHRLVHRQGHRRRLLSHRERHRWWCAPCVQACAGPSGRCLGRRRNHVVRLRLGAIRKMFGLRGHGYCRRGRRRRRRRGRRRGGLRLGDRLRARRRSLCFVLLRRGAGRRRLASRCIWRLGRGRRRRLGSCLGLRCGSLCDVLLRHRAHRQPLAGHRLRHVGGREASLHPRRRPGCQCHRCGGSRNGSSRLRCHGVGRQQVRRGGGGRLRGRLRCGLGLPTGQH
mmetsp:Transcript_95078/g.307803  ORF Transcript_95078/g.307803 Transcript_95078/m.307803 type:complete len:290 (-) Transcript_95078:109-978(-)